MGLAFLGNCEYNFQEYHDIQWYSLNITVYHCISWYSWKLHSQFPKNAKPINSLWYIRTTPWVSNRYIDMEHAYCHAVWQWREILQPGHRGAARPTRCRSAGFMAPTDWWPDPNQPLHDKDARALWGLRDASSASLPHARINDMPRWRSQTFTLHQNYSTDPWAKWAKEATSGYQGLLRTTGSQTSQVTEVKAIWTIWSNGQFWGTHIAIQHFQTLCVHQHAPWIYRKPFVHLRFRIPETSEIYGIPRSPRNAR